MDIQASHLNTDNGMSFSGDTKMMVKVMKHLMSIENNNRDPKIKEMVWLPKREDHVNVYLRTSVVMLGDIDALKQEFLCEFYLSVKWKEPRLKGKTEESQIDLENEWEPDIYFVDMVSSDTFERHRSVVKHSKQNGVKDDPQDHIPTVLFYYHVEGIFKELLDVRNFPFDYQGLDITVTSKLDSSSVTLLKDPEEDDNIRKWNFTAEQQ